MTDETKLWERMLRSFSFDLDKWFVAADPLDSSVTARFRSNHLPHGEKFVVITEAAQDGSIRGRVEGVELPAGIASQWHALAAARYEDDAREVAAKKRAALITKLLATFPN